MSTPSTGTAVPEPRVLQAARAGDQDAFGRLIQPHQGELLAHCYRMLGSMPDPEDTMQDASLRASRELARFEGRRSLRSWLYTIATNTCLSHIRRRPKRVLPIDYGPPTDPHDGPGRPQLPERSQPATLRDRGDVCLQELVEGYPLSGAWRWKHVATRSNG